MCPQLLLVQTCAGSPYDAVFGPHYSNLAHRQRIIASKYLGQLKSIPERFTYGTPTTALRLASAPASDPCCTTCPKASSHWASGCRPQTDDFPRSLLASRRCVISGVDPMSGRLSELGLVLECPLRSCCSSGKLTCHQMASNFSLTYEYEVC